MNALEKDLANVQYNTSQAEFDAGDDGTYKEVPGYNFRDQPSSFISRLQNPQFLDNPRTTGIGTLKNWASNKLGTGFNFARSALSGIGNAIMPGIGWALGAINPGKMRGYNYNQGRYNTQEEYEADRATQQHQNRVNNLISRMQSGKNYSQKNLNEITMGSRPGFYGNRSTVSNINRAKHNIGMPENLGDRGNISVSRSTNTNSPGHPSNANPGSGGGIGSAAAGRGPAGGSIGASRSRAQGGRIGYRNGEFVDGDINIEGPNFDFNENIEMAEAPSPFEMRVQELVDSGMSWQEAWSIASEEFGQVVEGESDQGIASLV
jgi:hypothetical protein